MRTGEQGRHRLGEWIIPVRGRDILPGNYVARDTHAQARFGGTPRARWRSETVRPTLEKTRDSAVLALVRMHTVDPRRPADLPNPSLSPTFPDPGHSVEHEARPSLHSVEHHLAVLDQVLAHLAVCRDAVARVLEERRADPAGSGGSSSALPPRKLTSDEAADRLQVTPETVNTWCLERKFPNATSLGRSGWRIPADEVDALNLAPKNRGRMRMRRAG